MAKPVAKHIQDILKTYELDPKEALWDCHGTFVMYHRYCEIIAAKAGIWFDPPQVMEARSADKTVAICVTGYMGDARKEWSFGEASPGNNKNAYPYAMAEKRAKDRVILKLVGLAGFVYSEEEADDFKEAKPAANDAPPKSPDKPKALILHQPQGDVGADTITQWLSLYDEAAKHFGPAATYELNKETLAKIQAKAASSEQTDIVNRIKKIYTATQQGQAA